MAVRDIIGFCPMGCGATLVLDTVNGLGQPACGSLSCPRRTAAGELLNDPETEHIVTFTETGFTIRHPLRERLDDALLDCDLHHYLADLGESPVEQPGKYRAVYVGHDPVSSSLHAALWDFEQARDTVTCRVCGRVGVEPGEVHRKPRPHNVYECHALVKV